jgi:hypothetical protein
MRPALSFAICFAAAALVARPARSDDNSVRLHGTISQFDGNYLTLKADSGKSIVVSTPPETRIVHSRMLSLSAIKVGDVVASLSMKDATGRLHALGLRVFETSVEVSGEGQYPMLSDPSRVVTDGTVSAVSASSGTLSLSFHGAAASVSGGDCTGRAPPGSSGCTGSADLVVARGVPIVAIGSGDTTLLRAGAIISVAATVGPSATLVSTAITVERDAKPLQ